MIKRCRLTYIHKNPLKKGGKLHPWILIAITFPKVKINAEIKDLTFDNLEDMIF